MSTDFGITHVQTVGDWKHRGDYPTSEYPGAEHQLLYSQDFDGYTLTQPCIGVATGLEGAQNIGTTTEGQAYIITDSGELEPFMSAAVQGIYPQLDGVNKGSHVSGTVRDLGQYMTNGDNHIYVRFWAKHPGTVKHGVKFCKVFGFDTGANQANTTFGFNYTGNMTDVSFGDGTILYNDTASVIKLDGSNPEAAGRSYGLPGFSIYTAGEEFSADDWGDTWHLFECYVKFNSGTTAENEVNDGEIILKIDNVLRVEAKGLYNRHYSNQPIESWGIFNWAQETSTGPFEYWYSNITVSKNGWIIHPNET